MNDPRPDSPHGDDNTPGDHFYRVVRCGPGAQRIMREPSGLDELRHALRFS